MALPKLTIKLFEPKAGKNYSGAGSLTLPLCDVHAFAEWLLGQSGEFDDYLKQDVVKLLAFEYHNESRGGTTYRTVQLKDPADLPATSSPGRSDQPLPAAAQRRATPTSPPVWGPPDGDSFGFDDDIPF